MSIGILDVLAHHGNHQVEQTDGLDEGETQNGVGEELTTESRVAGDRDQQGSEDETDTDTGTTETDGGRTHTNVLGDLNEGGGELGGVLAASLGVGEGVAGVGLEESGRLDALLGLEGGGEGRGLLLGGEGALGGRVQRHADGRASDLGGGRGHGGQARSDEAGGGHCEGIEAGLARRRGERRRCWRWDGMERELFWEEKAGGEQELTASEACQGINTVRPNFHLSEAQCVLVHC